MLDCSVDNYAEDTTLSATGKSLNEIEESLDRNCQYVSLWMQENRLKLNSSKTHILTVGTGQKLRSVGAGVHVTLEGTVLEENGSHSEKALGYILSSDLKWKGQYDYILEKLKKRLLGLRNLGQIAPSYVKKQMADGLFTSVLVYCLPLFGGTEDSNIRAVQVMQNKAAQIVSQLPPRSNRNKLYDHTGWMTVRQMVVYYTLLTVFNIRQSGEPEYLARKINNETRNRRLKLPQFKIQLAQRSFTYRGINFWNMLPANIRQVNRINQFKKLIKKWILSSVSRFED